MLRNKFLTPQHIILWWLDNGPDSVRGYEEVFEGFLRGPCTFEVVELENWPRIVVGAGAQMARIYLPDWCIHVANQMPSIWGSRKVSMSKDDVLRWLVYSIEHVYTEEVLEIVEMERNNDE
jgi:hypothetical protein